MCCQVVSGVFSGSCGSVGVCGVPRSLRGRPSQVKGALGVADAMLLRGTLDLRAYLLKRILHDWDDDQCVGILRNCRQAMAPGGRVLVVDAVIPPGNAPHQGKTLDLMMMASLVGRERTQADFARLFDTAGLRLARVIPTPTVLSIVEGVADDTPGSGELFAATSE
jgi:hypothetical protein